MDVHGYTKDGRILVTIDGRDWTVPDASPGYHRRLVEQWEAEGNVIPPYTQTSAERALAIRAKRDGLLGACDWVVTRAVENGGAVPEAWSAYRQALRDIPDQPGFPDAIIWPDVPDGA